ncbi:TPA: hypothetical protein ACX6R8_003140 [Photobacterium damselae]
MSSNSKISHNQQGIVERVLYHIPNEILDSFDDTQRNAIEDAIIASSRTSEHYIDFRPTFGLGRWRYYAVFLLGKNRRIEQRREKSITTIIKVISLVVILVFLFMSAVLTLYLIKSALGIDIFKNFSFGIWDYFKANFFQ